MTDRQGEEEETGDGSSQEEVAGGRRVDASRPVPVKIEFCGETIWEPGMSEAESYRRTAEIIRRFREARRGTRN